MEKSISVDQTKLARVEQLLADHPALFARQTSVVATWRNVHRRRLGPYFSLRFRGGGRQRSLYLGTSEQLAAEVRLRLLTAQQSWREHLAFERMRAAAKSSLRKHVRALRTELEKVGLTLKGSEVRGWCSARLTDAWDAIEDPHRTFSTVNLPGI